MPTGYRFAINPGLNDFYHPKTNLQYSLGGRGIKTCEFRSACNQNDFRISVSSDISPERNIFEKTLAFFCAVKEAGCSFDQRSDVELDYGGSDSAISECSFDSDQMRLCPASKFDISYLEALLSNDKRAYEKGYGHLSHVFPSITIRAEAVLPISLSWFLQHIGTEQIVVNFVKEFYAQYTTPRKLAVDAGFTKSLRQYLNWELVVDPSISELHPSLGNFDRVRRLINDIRKSLFQKELASVYVQCAEVYSIEGGKSFYLIICMSKDMALHLLTTKHLSIDTSFKHVHGKWQEFEMESWIEDRKRYAHKGQALAKVVIKVLVYIRNVNELRGKGVSSSAIEAMFSLATTVPQDLKHLYAVIEAGGPKACAWLKDKIDAKFVIPAIHHAESLIPLKSGNHLLLLQMEMSKLIEM
ncbi:hypothetical protein BDQ17DRAFT_1328238 [Cyathus striatus]|nr:hypothetical protein BDQ17DRAFT_1328238 [Cyathus striatus]